MNDPFQLVTNCNFKGKDYLVQMCVLNSKKLELIITDKIMAEDWQCEYDACYIEALTHKTGNFKQFDVFVMMLKSGLLKTSDCITLDLLTVEDLEQLRCKKVLNSNTSSRSSQSVHLNKRYLILTYSVEFDRIHYPLPLDYCGPPDPIVLQTNIRRLESEIERLKQKNTLLTRSDVGDINKFKERIQNLLDENKALTDEINRLNKLMSKKAKPIRNPQPILSSLKKLEEQVFHEKTHNRQIIAKLKTENRHLKQQVEEYKKKEKSLNLKLREPSRYNSPYCRKNLRRSVSPENLDFKKNSNSKPLDSLQCSRPTIWKTSSVAKSQPLRNTQNRFLSSSSSEYDEKEFHKARSREKKSSNPRSKKSGSSGKSSSDRSRHSSVDSKRKAFKSAPEEEVKPGPFLKPQSGMRSRDSSVSSKGSSKVSRTSNKGSGDGLCSQRKTSRSIIEDKEDIKFTMSDLETRIHSLQKLLSEGLHF